MPRVTVVPADNVVIVDGVSAVVDCSHVPSFVHAIQWDGTRGHIEFVPHDGVQQGNLAITSFGQFEYLVDHHAHALALAARNEAKREAALVKDKVKEAELVRQQKREFDAASRAFAAEQKKLDEDAKQFRTKVEEMLAERDEHKRVIDDLTERLEKLEKGE